MHIVFRETHGMEETAIPQDLGQAPAPLVVLSFSDSDLGAFGAAWHAARADDPAFPDMRLANLAALAHPLSVDTYVERTLGGARAILIRLIGGEAYWAYGLSQVSLLARAQGIALAVLPGDGRPDPRLDSYSTVPPETLRALDRLCTQGGAPAARAALALLAGQAGFAPGATPAGQEALPPAGGWHPDRGLVDPLAEARDPARPLVLVVFYRAYLAAGDLDPIAALIRAFEARGAAALGLFAPSLKAPEARGAIAEWIAALAPTAIVNATAFSARDENGHSPLDRAGVPVFQLALATAPRAAWEASPRGLSPADLAMHVVLPEIDGRILAGVASFKESGAPDPALGLTPARHQADPERIAAIVARVEGWMALARRASPQSLALVLSTYPGKPHLLAHAVGLDALASAQAILADLGQPAPADLATALQRERLTWPLSAYREALATLPPSLQADLAQAWGDPADDPACREGAFHFAGLTCGTVHVLLQPERGARATREDDYHDLDRVPCHGYVAFHLWLRSLGLDALLHLGAHGTLEWLPGKAVALSGACWPEVLVGSLPVVYPFIVNDPGEAAQAKRRIGAVTIGHAPPPLVPAGKATGLDRLEALLDEFSNADGLDPARRDRLTGAICGEAQALGLAADLGLSPQATAAETITRIDRFVCEIKESRFGEGLHVFGRGEQGLAERTGLRAALAGRRVAPGPSGSPYRGRSDVLPTGRNLYTIDPRAVPSRAAHAQGVTLAEELVRRHLQDHGDWPRALVVDLWGSATMRTAGEEFAMALHLLGAKPVWDSASDRVTGVEILPIALLERPRLDVTLRVSGLFRDAFPQLPLLFGQAVRALAGRDEPAEWNPFVGQQAPHRVYGPRPARYGLGMGAALETYGEEGRRAGGEAWLAASDQPLDHADLAPDPQGLRERVGQADAYVHVQDLEETDLLLAADYAAHEGGFAAAQAAVGANRAALYHLDSHDPARPVARPLPEEIARVVRARAAHPGWIAGMMRHGFRGGAELAATLDHLGAFAHLAGAVPAHLFDLYHDATLGDADVRAFLARENPGALAAMEARFAALHHAGLWQTRRNSILASLPDARA